MSFWSSGGITGKRKRGYIKEIELDDGIIVRDARIIVDKILGFLKTYILRITLIGQ